MLSGIGVEGFKAFKSENFLPFKKLNVFLGPNSSGKSSFLKAMLLLKNSVESKENNASLNFNEEIGDFKSVTYGKNKDGSLKFTISFDTSEKDTEEDFKKVGDDNLKVFIMGAIIKDLDKNFSLDEFQKLVQSYTKLYLKNPVKLIKFCVKEERMKNFIYKVDFTFLDQEKYTIKLSGDDYCLYNHNDNKNRDFPKGIVKPSGLFFTVDTEVMSRCEPSQVDKIFIINLALYDISNQIKRFFSNFTHIEPFRFKPNRTEHIANLSKGAISSDGRGAINTLLNLQIKKENEKITQINDWLNKFDLAESVYAHALKDNQYSLTIKNKFTGIESNIKDVGVGTSQLFPIILESILSPEKSVLIIEEPETHIHPNAQSRLADMFSHCITKEDKKFFIETHSMYFVQKLQILVGQSKVSKDDIGIYYFHQTPEGTLVDKMELLENGQFEKEFPSGFFDVAYELSKEFMNNIF